MVKFKKGFIAVFILLLSLVLVACDKDEPIVPDPVLPVFAGITDVEIEIGEELDLLEGITATWKDNDLTTSITYTGSVDNTKEGIYEIEYRVESELGDVATQIRKVTVVAPNNPEPIVPVIEGGANTQILAGTEFDPLEGVTATWDGKDITNLITYTGSVDTSKVGTYTLEYRVESENGEVATKIRKVTVVIPDERFTEASREVETLSDVELIRSVGNVYNDNGAKTRQEVYVFNQGDDVLVANWSKFNDAGKFVLSPTLDIAKDFELKNPGYEVVAAVNGDFFYADSGITYNVGANILFGNRVVKPDNFYAGYYYSVQFNQQGQKIALHKTLSFANTLNFALYDEDGGLLYYNNNVSLDATTVAAGKTSIMFNKTYVHDSAATYFVLNKVNEYRYGSSHTYFEAKVANKITAANSTSIVLATKDDKLVELLQTNQRLIVQNMTSGVGYNDMIIGVDAPIIQNSVVKQFTDLNTATQEQKDRNTARHPRTGFGYDANGKMVLITVDGRKEGSAGVDLREFGQIMKYYGIVEGYNLDGGGSTQAVFRVDGQLQYVNTPSENYRGVANALLFIREKDAKPAYSYTKTSGKLNVTLPNPTGIDSVEVKINGVSTVFTDLSKTLVADMPTSGLIGISAYYTKNGVKSLLFNDTIRNEPKVSFNGEKFAIQFGHDFTKGGIWNSANSVVQFTYEQWQEVSAIVDDPAYVPNATNYRIPNNALVVTDAEGKVVAIRLYQGWTADQSGILLTEENGTMKVQMTGLPFNRNNIEIGVMSLLPEGGFVYVFPSPTPATDDGFSASMKFGYRALLGIEPNLTQTASINGVKFVDFANAPINPFAEGYRITVVVE